ncbi:MAG: GatB/YqeY domain-containing protein [Acidobacteriota bacterium]
MKEKIQLDLTQGLKARQSVRVSTLRLLLSQIQNEEISRRKPLSREEILALIQRGIKTRRESIQQFERGGRADLVARESEEIAVLESYLPPQLSSEELTRSAEAIILELGAVGKKDMGQVMKALMERHAGQVDGRRASSTVAFLLK